jgi:hypothetical protein
MKRFLVLCLASIFLTVLSIGDAVSAGKGKSTPKKTAKKTERSVIQTFAGRVKAVDIGKKTITIAALIESEYYLHEKDTLMSEFDVEELDVTFDASQAKFVGVKNISGLEKGQLVRIGYDRKGNAYVAHTVLIVPKKQARSSIQTFLGKVTAFDPGKNTMTVRATMEGEFFFPEKDTSLKELVIEEMDITFDTAQAVVVGKKIITPGDTVRVGYDKENNIYVAHTILKIEKKQK